MTNKAAVVKAQKEEQKQQKRKQEESASASSSSEDSDGDSSSDEEVENALFRPAKTTASLSSPLKSKKEAATASPSSSSSASSSSSSESETEGEEESEEEAQEKNQEQTAKGKKDNTKKTQEKEVKSAIEEIVSQKTEATIYVEGISYDADEGDLVSHFSESGIVKEVRMPRYQDSGKPRGYAHVVFESDSSVAKALQLNGKYLMGRYLSIKKAQKPRTLELALRNQQGVRKVKGCRTVIVKQLPYDIEEETIKKALETCGNILSVRLPQWNHTKKLKGFGYVEFSTEDEALAATKRSGIKIGDRMVIIGLDNGAPKSSFRQRDGQYWNKGEEGKKVIAKRVQDKQHQKKTIQPAHKKRRV
jgi:nucleolin